MPSPSLHCLGLSLHLFQISYSFLRRHPWCWSVPATASVSYAAVFPLPYFLPEILLDFPQFLFLTWSENTLFFSSSRVLIPVNSQLLEHWTLPSRQAQCSPHRNVCNLWSVGLAVDVLPTWAAECFPVCGVKAVSQSLSFLLRPNLQWHAADLYSPQVFSQVADGPGCDLSK